MFATLSPHESTTTSNCAVLLSKQDRGISRVETVHYEKQGNKANKHYICLSSGHSRLHTNKMSCRNAVYRQTLNTCIH